jgi:DNA polymerase-1
MQQSETLILIDAHNLVFRLFHSGVTSTNVFLHHVNTMAQQLPEGRVILVGDSGRSDLRTSIDPQYKQSRSSTPPELIDQLRAIPDAVRRQGLQWLSCAGWEADDIIFTLVDKNFFGHKQIIVATPDKDLLQLLTYPHAKFWDSIKRKFITRADVVEKFGVPPESIGDLLALMGDASDNVPGVPKIGPKTAAQLLSTYGSLDNLLANLDQLPNDAKSNSLRANTDAARTSRKLVELYHVPLDPNDLAHTENDIPPSDKSEVLREVLETGWVVYSATTIASASHWSESNILEVLEALPPDTRILHSSVECADQVARTWEECVAKDNNRSDLSQAHHEDIALLHHMLYGNIPRQYPDTQIHHVATLWQKMQQDLVEYRCAQVYHMCNRALPRTLREMEKRGAYLDLDTIKELGDELQTELRGIERKIYDQAGRKFLISSPQQLGQVLSIEMRLADSKKTDALSLESIDHPIIPLISEFRQISKLLNTYITPLKMMVDDNGRVHTSYTLTVTKTGRLSSVRPNLQNIPARTERGKRLRNAFQAPPDRMLVAADYDQMELRLLAHMGPVPELIVNFQQGVDWHSHVSQVLFGDNCDAHRRQAKAVTFGLIYGMSAFGLSKRLHIPLERAQEIKQMYYDKFPGIKSYQDRMIEYASKYGYVETLWGRRCYVTGHGHEMHRQAINAAIQGTAADMIKYTMQGLPNLILQVHDELVAEVAEGEVDSAATLMKEKMEFHGLDVPIIVNVSVGKKWGALEVWQR